MVQHRDDLGDLGLLIQNPKTRFNTQINRNAKANRREKEVVPWRLSSAPLVMLHDASKIEGRLIHDHQLTNE